MNEWRKIRFTIPCNPPKATAQQKGAAIIGGRIRFFTKAKVKAAEDFLAGIIAPYAPECPADNPVSLRLEWIFPYRKSEKKAAVKAGAYIRHTVRPDLDNLEKGVLDTMTRLGFWRDDAQIFRKRTAKYFGATPRISVEVCQLDQTAVEICRQK